jgi:hypothetical protein
VGEWPNHTQRGKEEEKRKNYIHTVYFTKSGFLKITFKFFLYLFITRKVDQQKTFPVKEKFNLFSGKCFLFILNEKHFPEVVKNLKMLCNLLIISNLILKLLIAIYFVLNLVFFSISSFRI